MLIQKNQKKYTLMQGVMEQTFGQRLKELREAANLTQSELASRIGIHSVSLSRLEVDEFGPTWSTVQAIAKALGVSCSAFEGTVDPPKKDSKPKSNRGRPRKSQPDE